MPYTFKIEVPKQRVDVKFFGRVTGHDVNNALTEIFFHPDWQRAFNHIWDGGGISELDFGYHEFMAMKKIVNQITFPPDAGQGCMAVVVPNRTGYVMARAGQAVFPKCKPFGIFRKRSAAEEWIKLYSAPYINQLQPTQYALWKNA